MRIRAASRFVFLGAIAVLLAFAGPGTAFAAPPANDVFAGATPASSVPYSDSGDLTEATTEAGEPQYCIFKEQTVWYALTLPNATPVTVDLTASDPGVSFAVFQSWGPPGDIFNLGFMFGSGGCGGGPEFTAQPGTTYYIQVGSSGPAHFQLNVQPVPPPANDDFGNATAIDARPFVGFVDLTAATLEAGEPSLPSGAFTPIVASAWYAYTPSVTEKVMASGDSCCVTPIVTVYTGSSVQGLTEVASRSGFGGAVFDAAAGTTYYIQLGRGSLFGGSAPMSLRLDEAPPPVAQFGFFPGDPSIYEAVQFNSFSQDPAQVGFASQEWQFGDGTTGTGPFTSHSYAADGDYTVDLAVTTLDGRTASTSQVVHVRTHDVAITKFTVPTSARAGQTRELTVGIRNSLYPESVQVQLYKSVPGGFQLVGTLTQLIPVRPGNKTVPVSFSYTFSGEDAAVGKVTFQAVATIIGGRDALPADNTAISSPTRVTP